VCFFVLGRSMCLLVSGRSVCFFVFCNRHGFNKVPEAHLDIACAYPTSTPQQRQRYAQAISRCARGMHRQYPDVPEVCTGNIQMCQRYAQAISRCASGHSQRQLSESVRVLLFANCQSLSDFLPTARVCQSVTLKQ
jgi:hypothetical protein